MGKDINQFMLVDGTGDGLRTFFDISDGHYVVPLYQRSFAWGSDSGGSRENEIIQLMDDIMDVREEDSVYYLGSLVVSRKDQAFEVIDGQQRLTALYLLFHCLDLMVEKEDAFTYACREASNYAIHRIRDLVKDASLLEKPCEPSLLEGVRTILRKIQSEEKIDSNYKAKMIEAMRRVCLFRVCVPAHTDLNRYFEVMNTRGEQLEPHDIVKAMLMRPLDENGRALFSEVWNACRDMTGYVQMHFGTRLRKILFGNDWQSPPKIEPGGTACLQPLSPHEESLDLATVLSSSFAVDTTDGVADNDERIRFESIIGFPHFLLHVLKVFVRSSGMRSVKPDEPLIDELLDDKKLFRFFERVSENGLINGVKLAEGDFSWGFLNCLLRCRFLFDKFIIKREFKGEDPEGEWSLQELKVTGSRGSKRPYYAKTEFRNPGKWRLNSDYLKDRTKMIQACLRVSYTSPKSMHWITELLFWLFANNCENVRLRISSYLDFAERLAAEAVADYVGSEDAVQNQGVGTPHIVFNFLDYLLWRDGRAGSNPFVFEFRNSVEHWYPKTPSDGTFPKWDQVNRFGNLCLLQSKINAKFYNLSPESKKGTFGDMIAKGSLKLREMAVLTVPSETLPRQATEQWRDENCERHEKEMLTLLHGAVSRLLRASD